MKRGAGKSRANDPLLLALNAKPPERTEASGVAKGKSEGEKRKEVAGRRSGGLVEAELIAGFQSVMRRSKGSANPDGEQEVEKESTSIEETVEESPCCTDLEPVSRW